jgi:hypothetical protein
MSRPRKVRSVRNRTIGSQTRWLDEHQIPAPVYYGCKWALGGRRWRVSVPVTVLLVAWSGAGLRGGRAN